VHRGALPHERDEQRRQLAPKVGRTVRHPAAALGMQAPTTWLLQFERGDEICDEGIAQVD
jgi:hypothetical protein